ncbi:AMP-dependent synthetase and ligase [Sulfurimonas gotlandica GD1]|uniref:AMP-dependent synthetase and ligase n=1 Tax=Sulfurimonas gotlandica (strain DSM 19862 / JCM 16533 / GD1) TaxID=929558 RepID=B6BJF6_SULGG|nr:AMP-binding protein [Sulfurimonas gotlandica]EDZ62481.1 AMP-dependent synthetase and ligase [Sulfurimonas gotlandica GD1]EHP31202.1 AMP-dependent synthetase and ligase [Sulfurimonas gotlandica GD1]
MSINCIRTLIEDAAQSHSDKTALVFNEKSITYSELFTKVNQVAYYLKELDLPKDSRIGIYSNKGIEQVIAILAILSTDYILVPLTKLLKSEQVEYIIKDCDIKCIITDRLKLESIEEINFDGHIISYETAGKEIASFEEIFKYYNKPYACDINGHSNALITYSFGMSGTPKGIVISHRNLIDSARVVSQYLKLEEDDVISAILIFNLDYGLNQIFCTLYKRATLAIHRFILAEDFFNHLINDKVTVIPLMPINITQMFDEDMHRIPSSELFENVKTITSSGGNVTARMISACKKTFTNADFYSMHGLTEAFRSTYLDPSQVGIRPDSIGKAIPDVELYVINKDGKECAVREVGELIHRGGYIYKGFWNAPEQNAERFKSVQILKDVINLEGQLTDEIVVASGDYVYKDEEGYFYFVSRHDNMIKTRGFRVSPYEIESVVSRCFPQIEQCAVFSVNNELIEEEIIMVYSAPSEIAPKEILFELKKHLASYMIPSRVIYKKSLPLVQSDKNQVNKDELKRELSQN